MSIGRFLSLAMAIPFIFPAVSAIEKDNRAYHKVVKIIDGDTITVKIDWADFARTETVRLLGVDAPERKLPYAKESTTWMTNLLKGEEVRLEYHPGPNPTRDRYGRILAYVYRAPDDFDVNLELVRQGYAELYLSAKHRRQEDFTKAADHARTRKKGLWQKAKAK